MKWRNFRNFILLPLFIFAMTILPAATPVRIGFVGIDKTRTSTNHIEKIFSLLAAQDDSDFFYEKYRALISNRIMRNQDLSNLTKRHETIEEADGNSEAFEQSKALVTPAEVNAQSSSSVVEWIQLDISSTLARALVIQDMTVSDYVLKSNQLDLLIICVIEPLDTLVRLRIREFQSDGVSRILYEGIAVPSEVRTLVPEAIVTTISAYKRSSIGLLQLEQVSPGLTVAVDGEQVEIQDTLLVLEEGTRNLVFSALGFKSRAITVEIQSESVQEVEIALSRIDGPPLLITSDSGMAEITIPYVLTKQVPVVWESQQYPFVLYAQEEGRRLLTVQHAQPVEEVNISLHPLWMVPVYGTAREQEAMYASLGRTMLLGGLTIILDSVSRSVASYTDDLRMWQPAILGAAGAMAVSLFDTGTRLFAYYQKTKYSSR